MAALATTDQFVAAVLQRPALAVRTLVVCLKPRDRPPGADLACLVAGDVIATVLARPRADQPLDAVSKHLIVAVVRVFESPLCVGFVRVLRRTRRVELVAANVV
jgi:hypothetical protein